MMSDGKGPIGKPMGPSMAPSAPGPLTSVLKRSSALRLRADESNSVPELARGLPCIRSWAL